MIQPQTQLKVADNPNNYDLYRQVLDDFLRRNYPMAKAWIGQIGWQIEKNQLGSGAAPIGEHEEDGLLTLALPGLSKLRSVSPAGAQNPLP